MLTAEELRALLEYSPETGRWRWRVAGHKRVIGRAAGWQRKDGRWRICVERKTYYASRLAWLYMTGEWPPEEVDHRDLDKSNDRWENLRLGDHGQNQSNSRARKHNITGVKGVSATRDGKYQAKISIDGQTVSLGRFETIEAAHAAYCAAAKAKRGSFFRAA